PRRMKAALIIGGLGIALVVMTPALRALLPRSGSRMSNEEYFAAARKRAIRHRLAKSASTRGEPETSGDE
ncbi:MAG: hypothetical protein ABI580_11175, partial [Burkholderiaceae bacterium]